MKSWRRIALLAGAIPACGMAMAPPPPGDFLKLLLEESIKTDGPREAMRRADKEYAADLLMEASSPYAEVTGSAPAQNELAWDDARQRLADRGRDITSQQALAIQQWDLGFTKSRPGQEVPLVPPSFRSDVMGANAVKAGVQPDIFWKALDLSPFGHYTIGARWAVAAQMLRERLRDTDPASHADQGLRKDVLDRFMAATAPGQLSDYDAFYLDRIVEGAASRWSAGRLSAYGYRELPTLMRIARVGAAYALRRQQTGYPCDARGLRNAWAWNGTADDHRMPCFNDATDRAVVAWYAAEQQRQVERVRPQHETVLQHFRHAVGRIIGFGIDFVTTVGVPEFELASSVELVDSAIARDLVAEKAIAEDGADIAHERAAMLTCGVMKR